MYRSDSPPVYDFTRRLPIFPEDAGVLTGLMLNSSSPASMAFWRFLSMAVGAQELGTELMRWDYAADVSTSNLEQCTEVSATLSANGNEGVGVSGERFGSITQSDSH
jgi:hypothetical protein